MRPNKKESYEKLHALQEIQDIQKSKKLITSIIEEAKGNGIVKWEKVPEKQSSLRSAWEYY